MKIKEYIQCAIALLCVLVLTGGCAAYNQIIKSEPVNIIPDKKYEVIIRLDTPEGMPFQPDAGFVYVEPQGKVSTDFARQVFVKNLDLLDENEQINRDKMGKFVIKDRQGRVRGYYEILFEYRTVIWEKGEDILLQIIIPGGRPGSISDVGFEGVGVGIVPGGTQ